MMDSTWILVGTCRNIPVEPTHCCVEQAESRIAPRTFAFIPYEAAKCGTSLKLAFSTNVVPRKQQQQEEPERLRGGCIGINDNVYE